MNPKTKFITKDDEWGIREALKEIYGLHKYPREDPYFEDELFRFDIFFNQFLPPAFYETRTTVIRHIDEIKRIRFGHDTYQESWIWIKRNNQLSCAIITNELLRQLKENMIELPLYLEIEEEKKKWQQTPGYQSEKGFSDPIKEEFIQLKIVKKGGE